ncbi:hypothetical protein NEOLEDRAFT_1129941 [Neolentinus lepideus HHB14362 ss-1]|uniref:Uncharacterized protein n=1 Tax=Neolentinus lepideus HHB14362 ss-1 TaxID=1314782 RepID=A0A165UE68_9AGAM|nr:hypothetical protein NEOLEDRAFT_1129941 [Neolentinus lepideus HHB14362 ss-1]
MSDTVNDDDLQVLAKEGVDTKSSKRMKGHVSTTTGEKFRGVFAIGEGSSWHFHGTAEAEFLPHSLDDRKAEVIYQREDQLTGKRTFKVRKFDRFVTVFLGNGPVIIIHAIATHTPNGSGEWKTDPSN